MWSTASAADPLTGSRDAFAAHIPCALGPRTSTLWEILSNEQPLVNHHRRKRGEGAEAPGGRQAAVSQRATGATFLWASRRGRADFDGGGKQTSKIDLACVRLYV